MQEVQQEQQQAIQQQAEMEAVKQTPNMLKAPMLDPSKNPQLTEQQEGQPPQPPQ